MTVETMGMRGKFGARLYGPDGRLMDSGCSPNVVILAGRALIGEILQNGNANAATVLEKIGVGTGRTAVLQTDTDLETSLLKKAINTSSGFDNSNLTADPPNFDASVQFDSSEAIGNVSEAGIFFDDLSMFAHTLFGQGSTSAITKANPCQITSTAHGLSTGHKIYFEGETGMTELNALVFTITKVDANNFTLDGIDSTAYGTANNDGTWTRVFVKTSSDILVVTYTLTL